MKLLNLFILGGGILFLGACHPHWNGHPVHGHDFCPPGQAKKGNC